jgi:hypothetical protein
MLLGGVATPPRQQREIGVLYSQAARVAFAHYPKTAGCSLQHWFRRAFPDSRLLVPDNPHLPVRESLAAIAAGRPAARLGWRAAGEPRLVVGVLREPFEMLVSLFEFWREFPFAVEPDHPFILSARRDAFPEFLELAVIAGQMPTYESFFDVGGPAWPQTRLIHLEDLPAGLHRVAAELRLWRRPPLERHNCHAGPRDLAAYRRQAGSLAAAVRRHFCWYFEHGLSLGATRSAGYVA